MARARRKRADTATTTSPKKTREGTGATPSAREVKKHRAKRARASQKGAKKRVRVSKGVYRDRWGLAATVKVNGMQRERRFPKGTPLRTIQAWRDEMRGNLRTLPKGAKHTLAHDAARYLKQKEGELISIRDRRRAVRKWVERFGHLRTLALERHVPELNEQLHAWRKERSAATCNHRRDALTNLVRTLYGKKAGSGLADLVMFKKAPPKRRGRNRAEVAAVLKHMEPGSATRIRLELMHWTGMRPKQVGRLKPEDFQLDEKEPHVVVPPAKGGDEAEIPLLEEGVATARAYIAADAFGMWSTKEANKELREAAAAAGIKPFTTYQIRHSFATGLRDTGTDIADIQYMYGHLNPETTKRYAPANLEKNAEALRRLRSSDEELAERLRVRRHEEHRRCESRDRGGDRN